jgi:predicted N-acyltransferase
VAQSVKPQGVHRTNYHVPVLSVHHSIRDLDPAAWDALAGETAFGTHGWLLTLEASVRGGVRPIYFTIRENGRVLAASAWAAVPCTRDVETLDDADFGRAAPLARRVGASLQPALVCGPSVGYGWQVGVHPDLTPEAADAARERILEAAEAEARRQGVTVAVPYVLENQRALRRLLERRGYLACRNTPVALLDVAWRSYDEYLGGRPRRMRATIRHQATRSADAGAVVQLASRDLPREDVSRLQALVDANARKHGGRPFTAGPPFFEALTANLRSHARVFTCRQDGATTGVCVVLVKGDTACPVVVGVDDERSRGAFTYFEVTYHAPIANAIHTGIRRMYYGRGLEDLKQRRGCTFIDTWVYVAAEGLRRPALRAWCALASEWNRRKLPARVRGALANGNGPD